MGEGVQRLVLHRLRLGGEDRVHHADWGREGEREGVRERERERQRERERDREGGGRKDREIQLSFQFVKPGIVFQYSGSYFSQSI